MVIRYTEIYAQFVYVCGIMRNSGFAGPEKSTGFEQPIAASAELFSARATKSMDHAGLADFDAFPSREIP
jgi:hypothetical protein